MIYLLLIIYQLKHFVCDFPLQNEYMLGKFKGGRAWILPLLAHASVHGAATFLIVLFVNPKSAFLLALFDMTVHFTMDRIKASPNMLGRFKNFSANEYTFITVGFAPPSRADIDFTLQRLPNETAVVLKKLKDVKSTYKSNTYFWWALGLDQGVHHLTHYFIIWRLLS